MLTESSELFSHFASLNLQHRGMSQFLTEPVQWPNGIDIDNKAEFLINTFELKIVFPIYLYREAIRLQCFTLTRYVSGRDYAHMNVMTITRFVQNYTGGCLHCGPLLCM